MNTTTMHKLFDLPLGSRFRYPLDIETVYVLLSKDDRGKVTKASDDAGRLRPQTTHAAASTRAEFLQLRVQFVPVQEVGQDSTPDLLSAGIAMRRAQADYFRTRTKEALIASKEAEKAFDRLTAQAGGQQ